MAAGSGQRVSVVVGRGHNTGRVGGERTWLAPLVLRSSSYSEHAKAKRPEAEQGNLRRPSDQPTHPKGKPRFCRRSPDLVIGWQYPLGRNRQHCPGTFFLAPDRARTSSGVPSLSCHFHGRPPPPRPPLPLSHAARQCPFIFVPVWPQRLTKLRQVRQAVRPFARPQTGQVPLLQVF
jgi:hypothetical protein